MSESEAIVRAWDIARSKGIRCVLATVVHVEGSAFRRAGVRMLVDAFGNMTGAISGGCLEGDALRKALHALAQGRNKLVTYDTRDEDDAAIGAQLGCQGVIQVLFEPLDADAPENPVELLRKASAVAAPAALVCVFDLEKKQPQPGTCLLATGASQVPPSAGSDMLAAEIAQALADRRSRVVALPTANLHAFVQVLLPPPVLVIVGAGHDAQVLARMADLLGWEIRVVDGRPTHARADRFAPSCQVLVGKPDAVPGMVPADRQTAVVLLTHNYHYDLAVLELLLGRTDIAYLGILGPRKKYERMIGELAVRGLLPTAVETDHIFAPVGLHLGAETPAEIALAILAEIQAVLTGSDARSLRTRNAPIHTRTTLPINTPDL
ncbi:MAG: XdhC family protein [Bacteroidia bacterium]